MANNGLVSVESRFGGAETIDRLVAAVTGAGLRVFARIGHAAGARGGGVTALVAGMEKVSAVAAGANQS